MLTVIEKVIFLQNIDVLAEVPTEALAALAAIAEEVSYASGENIYKENDSPDALYFVLDGRVRLHKGDQNIVTAENKQAFGTWALFDESPRLATATVEEDCDLLRIDRDDFIDLLADNVQITQGVLKMMARRLRGLVERVSQV
jgi:CRP/FNR family cyclic AMP-dependent transcriptional regulator